MQQISGKRAIEIAMYADPAAWAHCNKLQVMGGPYQTHGYEYQLEPLQSEAPIRAVKKATQLA